MADDSVDPIGKPSKVYPTRDAISSTPNSPEGSHMLSGKVVAVHRKTGHHEGGHLLDTSVGATEHNEIVIQIAGGDLSSLVGRSVSIRIDATQ